VQQVSMLDNWRSPQLLQPRPAATTSPLVQLAGVTQAGDGQAKSASA
jgi:hypothetical protein